MTTNPGTFHSDNGGQCFHCGETIHRYDVAADGVVDTYCFTCHRASRFVLTTPCETACEMSAAHRGQAG